MTPAQKRLKVVYLNDHERRNPAILWDRSEWLKYDRQARIDRTNRLVMKNQPRNRWDRAVPFMLRNPALERATNGVR